MTKMISSIYRCNVREFLSDLLNFMKEQIGQAVSNPADQLAAIDAASGVIPAIMDRLTKPENEAIGFPLLLNFQEWVDTGWRERWDALAQMPRDEFAGEAAALLNRIDLAEKILNEPF